MARSNNVSCALCQRSNETKITGALSTKAEVTAHENCLFFSSGICCENSPEFDDLFGFSVEDVLKEVKRGNKLLCHYCKKKGATAGCEVKRCKKSYHYPCAVKDGAKTIEDEQNGCYGLYCLKHYSQQTSNNDHVNGLTKPGPSKSPTEAGPSKVYCLACEQVEGNIHLDSLSHSITMAYCDKHAPPSHKKTNGNSTAGSPSVHSNDSSSSNSTRRTTFKRPLNESEKQEESPSKRRTEARNGIVSDDTSDSDENETVPETVTIPPLEFDLDESANSVPEDQLIRADTESATGSTAGNQQEKESREENKDDDETIIDSVKCSSVQSPVPSTVQHTSGPSVPQQSSPAPPPLPLLSPGSPPCPSSSIAPAPPETASVPILSSARSPTARPSDSESGINATNFWKSCNAAGCTQAIFADFINGMNEIYNRILSDKASQEDYDLALSVMAVSGKLAELVDKQQEELQKKQIELQKAAAAMKDAVSALRK
uniref:PHD-type domain-containing protein n=1 Tax=Amphiprion ocellaris TaxID=80972 RepID=A0AAQ6APJ1_AMPOC